MRLALVVVVAACTREPRTESAPRATVGPRVVIDRDAIRVDDRQVVGLVDGELTYWATADDEPQAGAVLDATRASCAAHSRAEVRSDGAVPYATFFAVTYSLRIAGCTELTLSLAGESWTIEHETFRGDTPSTHIAIAADMTDAELAAIAARLRDDPNDGILILTTRELPMRTLLTFLHATPPQLRRVFAGPQATVLRPARSYDPIIRGDHRDARESEQRVDQSREARDR